MALIVSACGGTGSGNASTQLKGSPVTFGFSSTTNSTSGANYPEFLPAAQAAVDYINAHGGIAGHPVHLQMCATDGTVDSSTACGHEFVDKSYPLDFIGVDDAGAVIQETVNAADIPYATEQANFPTENTSNLSYSFSPGNTAVYLAAAKYAKSLHRSREAFLGINTPSISVVYDKFVVPNFNQFQIQSTLTLIPSGGADVSPYVEKALAARPDLALILGSPAMCASVYRALGQLNVSVTRMVSNGCAGSDVSTPAGAAYDGTYVIGDTLGPSDSNNADVQLYLKAMQQYAPNTPLGGFARFGFAELINTWRVLTNRVSPSSPITAPEVTRAFSQAKSVPSFMTSGGTFTCDGKQITGAPGLCGDVNIIEQFENGNWKYRATVDTAALFRQGL